MSDRREPPVSDEDEAFRRSVAAELDQPLEELAAAYFAETAAAIASAGELEIDLDKLRAGLLSTLRLEVGAGLMRILRGSPPEPYLIPAGPPCVTFGGLGWEMPVVEMPRLDAGEWWLRPRSGDRGAVGGGGLDPELIELEPEAARQALLDEVTRSLVLLGLVDRP